MPAPPSTPPEEKPPGVKEWLAFPLTLAAGCISSLACFLAIRSWEGRTRRNEARALSRQRTEELRVRMLSLMEVLHSVASHHKVSRGFSMNTFAEFVKEALDRHPTILALAWNPWVPAEDRHKLEERGRKEIAPHFHFTELSASGALAPASGREVHVPVFNILPLEKNRAALGYDLASEPTRREALERARDTGEPVATLPLRLVQEPENQLGYLVLMPLYNGRSDTLQQRRKNLVGFASAAFRIGDMVQATNRDGKARNLALAVFDHTERLIFSHPTGKAATPVIERVRKEGESLEFAGGHWKVVAGETGERLNRGGWQSWAALGVGLTLTGTFTAYVWKALRRRAEVEREVDLRTRDLSNEVGERQRAERELREAESKYRGIFENAIEGIFQTTPDGSYLSANPALARIYGYPSAEALIADLRNIDQTLYVESGRRAEFIRAIRQHGFVDDFESQVRQRDGTVIWILEKARSVTDAGGDLLYYEGTVQDITDRKQAEADLEAAKSALEVRVRERTAELARANEALLAEIRERKRAEDAAEAANRAKTAFLAHMSHEIRTPLNAILGYAQILQRDSGLKPRQQAAVETIASSGQHLFGLIDDVLDISKIEAGRMELQIGSFDLHELIRRIEAMFTHRCSQRSLALRVTPAADVPHYVQGDQGKLRQVLINLLGNAVKFTDTGGVELRVTEQEPGRYLFEVADTGQGIDMDDQKRIFEPFHQTDEGQDRGGTGLGLSISQRFIHLMGGKLSLESEFGAGSRFFFELPLPAAQEAPPLGTSAMFAGTLAENQAVRALVVDDIRENRDVLGTMLETIGCEVRLCANGEEALREVEEWSPQIVFMDIWMPGANGIQVTQKILARKGSTRVVAHSASAFDHDQKRYIEAGFDDFFAKPFRWERVCASLEKIPGVRFIERPPAAVETEAPALALPQNLAGRLHNAAELHNITELKSCLAEIDALGTEGGEAARHIARWMNAYEMNRIMDFARKNSQPFTVPAYEP